MNYRRLSDNELANFATNVVTLLGGTEISAIAAAIRTELVTEIASLHTNLADQALSAAVAEAERKSAVSVKNSTRESVIGKMSKVRNHLLANLAPRQQFDLCGFDAPAEEQSMVIAQDPTKLSAFGYSNGVNRIVFSGNNKFGTVTYEIWRRQGGEGPWLMHATTRKQSYDDSPVTPGQNYEYKVRAVAAKSMSNFSNPAVV